MALDTVTYNFSSNHELSDLLSKLAYLASSGYLYFGISPLANMALDLDDETRFETIFDCQLNEYGHTSIRDFDGGSYNHADLQRMNLRNYIFTYNHSNKTDLQRMNLQNYIFAYNQSNKKIPLYSNQKVIFAMNLTFDNDGKKLIDKLEAQLKNTPYQFTRVYKKVIQNKYNKRFILLATNYDVPILWDNHLYLHNNLKADNLDLLGKFDETYLKRFINFDSISNDKLIDFLNRRLGFFKAFIAGDFARKTMIKLTDFTHYKTEVDNHYFMRPIPLFPEILLFYPYLLDETGKDNIKIDNFTDDFARFQNWINDHPQIANYLAGKVG